MIFASLPAGPRRLSALPLTRHAFLVSTILGAGALGMASPSAWADDVDIQDMITSPRLGQYYRVAGCVSCNLKLTTVGEGTITLDVVSAIVTTVMDGTTTIEIGANITGSGASSSAGIEAVSRSGDINIFTNIGTTVRGFGTGISAESSSGAINITAHGAVFSGVRASSGSGNISIHGDGDITGTTRAGSQTGSIMLSGAGNITQDNGDAARLSISGGSGDIVVTRSGSFNGSLYGIYATNSGSGEIRISGVGAVTGDWSAIFAKGKGNIDIGGANGLSNAISGRQTGIFAQTDSGTSTINIKTTTGGTVAGGISTINNSLGATVIDVGANMEAGSSGFSGIAISATSTSGAVTIKMASGVDVTARTIGISVTSTAGGAIDIGGAAGLGGAVSGRSGGAISATTTGTGTVAVKTASGGNLNGGQYAIKTTAVNGATSIAIGTGSTVTGLIQTTTTNGNVVANNAGTVKGSIKAVLSSGGTGTFTFNNTGTLTLNSSETNTGFTLNNQSGGVLTGTGNFGAVNAASGSIIRLVDRTLAAVSDVPVMGTLNATSLTLASGAIVDVRVDYSGVSDKVAVTGAAALNGATLSIKATPRNTATWVADKTFTVLTAGSITGTFGAVVTDYAYLTATAAVAADGRSVTATLARATTGGTDPGTPTSFSIHATNAIQRSLGITLDKFLTQDSNPVIQRITMVTATQAPIALTQLAGTGVVATRTQSFAAGSVFSGAINSEMGRFTSSAGGSSSVLSYAEDTKIKSKAFDKIAPKPEPIPDGRIWAQMLGGIGNMKSDANNPSQRGSNYGLAAGADTAINANLRAGFALSLGQSTTKVSSLATSTESTWGQGALYAVATDGDTYLKGALTYGYLDSKTDRSVTAFGTVDKAKGKFGANLYSVRLEAGQKFAFDPVNLTPFLAFEPSWLMQNAYNETGPASITLGFGKTTSRALPTTLGGKIDASYDLGDYRMTPSASLGWVHDFATSGSISPFFTALPGSSFTAQGSRNDRNLARAELNIEASPKDTWATIYLNASADVGARTNAVRGVAGMSLRF